MKLSRSTCLRLTAAILAAVLAFPVGAFAALEDPWSGTSTTNPNARDDENTFWREGWGNSFWPNVVITTVPTDGDYELATRGFLYEISRLVVNPQPGSRTVDVSWDPSGAMLTREFDLQTIYNDLPNAERVALEPYQVIHHPLEGRWKLNMRFYSASRISTRTSTLDFGVDVTPPRPIAGLTAAEPSMTEHGRRTYSFERRNYDDLSGAYWYELFVNGRFERRVPVSALASPRATIETLPPGVNVVGFRVMDRATNVSPIVTRTEIVDPDVPTLSIANPGSGQYLAGVQTFEVKATDAACSPRVTMRIDGRVWRDLRRGPYKMQIDTRWLSAGYHTFSVTAKDLYGHTRSVTRGFYVDNRPVRVSSVSDAPDPFYPLIRDGIKDTTTLKLYLDEGATDVFLKVFTDTVSKTPLMERHWTRVGAGTFSTKTDYGMGSGQWVMDYPGSATLYYQWIVRDRAGNWTITGKYPSTFRNYEVVRTSSGSVRVVPR